MSAKQLSVFIENRQGRLGEVLSVLKNNEVNLLSLSLADTTEYGILRLIVSYPERGKECLTKAGFSCMLADVLVVKIPHRTGALQEILECVSDKVSVEYAYGLSTDKADACVVLKVSDIKTARDVLSQNGIETLSTDEIDKL